MTVELREVETLRDLRTFVTYPLALYRGNPYYVPTLIQDDIHTLRRDRNPAFDFCEARYWLAYSGKQVVGRLAAIVNPHHLVHWHQAYLRFGWTDFVDDPDVTAALFGAAEAWAREKGLTAVHGPLGFTDLDREGMLVEGFDELGTMATFYNYPYYPEHLERLGYVKDVDWMEYEIKVPSEPNEAIARIADVVMRRYGLRKLDVRRKSELMAYARPVLDLLNEEYQSLYSVVPLTERQIDAYVKQYFSFIDPAFAPVILDNEDRVVAFAITMPSLSRALQKSRGHLFPLGVLHLLRALHTYERGDLYLVAVRKEYQGKGVNAAIMHYVNQVFVQKGIRTVESNPELETNTNVQGQWKYYERRQHKRRRCYIKYLT